MYIYTWFGLYHRNAPAPADSTDSTPKPRGRPLYDVPYMFEAREFLRKKLIGKKVRFWIMLHFITVLCHALNDNTVTGMVLQKKGLSVVDVRNKNI